VAKDAQRPFTVFGGQLATTAVGTRFTITARATDSMVHVQLHEGKVLIKALQAAGISFTPVYLVAGQELAFNENTHRSVLSRGADTKDTTVHSGLTDNSSPGSRKGVSLTFEAMPLAKVLKQLESHYNVPIQYLPKDIQAMDFTGNIQKKDSLAKVLQRIALLNNLTVTRKGAGYLIRKNQ
jgi:ferric-dicitrate binding protein FerR (iron transport regulator)